MEPLSPRPATRPARGVAVELFKTALLAVAIFLAVRSVILPYEVEGSSMVPNLHNQERVLVNQSVYFHFDLNRLINLLPGEDRAGTRVVYPFHAPHRGDIVVLHPPVRSDKPYIKRIIGLPGESVAIRHGSVYINGQRLDEPYLHGVRTECRGTPYCAIARIPDGYVYVLGDNRGNSADSRIFGLVKIDELVGKAWFSNWPPKDFGPLSGF